MSKSFLVRAVRYAVYQSRLRFQRYTDRLLAAKRRKKLLKTDFTVISDSCLAGIGIYNKFGLQYTSPTIGCFISSDDYIRLLENFREEIIKPLRFKTISKNGVRVSYPLGVIGDDIEIHFIHYKNESEAREKWERRCKRINFNNLFFMFSDRDGFNPSNVARFAKLPYKHKIYFSSREFPEYKNIVVFLPKYSRQGYVDAWIKINRCYEKFFNVVGWLNGEVNYIKTNNE